MIPCPHCATPNDPRSAQCMFCHNTIDPTRAGAPPGVTAGHGQTTEEAEQTLAFVTAIKARIPWMTWTLASSFAVMFLLQLYFGSGDASVSLGRMGALYGPWLREGNVWILISSEFLHVNAMHVIFNIIALLSLAPMLEVLLGARRLFLAFVVSALLGSALAAIPLVNITVGASGGIWGLMTLTAVLVLRPNALVPKGVAKAMRPRVVRALVINAGISLIPGISMLGHLGGGIGGALLGLSGILFRDVRPVWGSRENADGLSGNRTPFWLAPATALLAAVVVASIGAAFVTGRPWDLLHAPTLERVNLGSSGLSLLVPRELRARKDETLPPATHTWQFGDPVKDGLLIVVIETHFEGLLSGTDVEAILETIKTADVMKVPPGFVATPVEHVLHAPRPWNVVRATAPDGSEYHKFVTLIGDNRVIVEFLTRSPAPAWRGREQSIWDGLEGPNG